MHAFALLLTHITNIISRFSHFITGTIPAFSTLKKLMLLNLDMNLLIGERSTGTYFKTRIS